MTSGKEIKFAARFAYLKAIEEHWPEVMSSLREGVFDEYRKCLPAMPNNELSDWRQLEAALHTSLSEPLKAFEAALQKWMGERRFRDEWILDAAVQRLCAWSHGSGIEWCYRPRDLKTERFQPRFGIWMPVYTPWPEFKKEMDAIYRAALVRYRRKVNISWGTGPHLDIYALWTVQWQQGKSPEGIRNRHLQRTGKRVSLANIQQRVQGFAASVDLTLREPRGGRRTKKI